MEKNGFITLLADGCDWLQENAVKTEFGRFVADFHIGRDDKDGEDRQVRRRPDGLYQPLAVQIGHPHVGQHHIERLDVRVLQNVKGLLPVVGRDDFEIALLLQKSLENHEVHLGVVHEKKAARRGRHGLCSVRDSDGARLFRSGCQAGGKTFRDLHAADYDRERRSLPQRGFDLELSSHRYGKLFADCKAKARAAVPCMAGVDLHVGRADALQVLLADAAARVLHVDTEFAARRAVRLVRRPQLHISLLGELHRIAHEVEHDLPYALWI